MAKKTPQPVLLLLFCLPFFAALDHSSVWDTTEAFYAQIPREMVESENWLVPTFNGTPRLDKPPLSHWVVGGVYRLFGIRLLWERLVMALAAAGSLAAVYLIGRQLFDARVALVGVGILSTTFRFHAAARRLPMDMLMLLCDLLAILCVILWVRKGQRAHHLLLAALLFALAFLTKGPVALFPLVFLIPWFLLCERKPLRDQAGRLALASALFLGVSLSWFVALGFGYGWEPVGDFFVRESLGRFAHMDFGPQRNVFYYFGVLAGDFAPWSLLLPGALVWAVRSRYSVALRQARTPLLFLGGWFIVYFGIFSLSSNKQDYYILPLYPAAALFTAFFLTRVPASLALRWGVGPLLFSLSFLIWWMTPLIFPGGFLLWLAPLALLGASFFAVARKTEVLLVAFALFYLLGLLTFQKPFERYRPIRGFAQTIQRQIDTSDGPVQAGYFRFAAPSLRFYLDRNILELTDRYRHERTTGGRARIPVIERAAEALELPSKVLLITDPTGLKELNQRLPGKIHVVETRQRFHTKARRFIQALIGGSGGEAGRWSADLYLISNQVN